MSFDNDKEREDMEADLAKSRIERPGDKLIGYVCTGDHRIFKLLGEGGMGLAYKAREKDGGEFAVVKTLKPEFANHTEVRARFQQEAEMLKSLKHPSIPYLKYIDRSCDPWLLVIEFCDGVTLSDYLRSKPETERKNRRFQRGLLQAMFGIIDALAVAHSKGITHRDVKPDNIIVVIGPNGEIYLKLIDFGIAKSTRGEVVQTNIGAILGTPGYIAPEQFMGISVGKAADIYSLGALFFEIFAGEPLIELASDQVMLGRAIKAEYVLMRLEILPIYIRAMMSMMLAMKPEDRFGGMYEVEGALRFIMRQMEIEDRRILESEVQEMKLLNEMARSNQIDGRLEFIGAQRVLIRQFEILNSQTKNTGKMNAVQEAAPPAPAPVPAPAQHQPSVEIPMDSLFNAAPASNPEYRDSDLRAAVQAAEPMAPPAAQAPVPSVLVSQHGVTILGQPAPAVSAVRAPDAALSAPASASAIARSDPTIPATPIEDGAEQKPEKKRTKSSVIPITVGVFIGILVLAAVGLLVWYMTKGNRKSDPAPRHDVTVSDASSPVFPKTGGASALQARDAEPTTVPVPATAQDGSVPASTASLEDTYKALEETCRTSEKGQMYWSSMKWRANCILIKVFTVEDLDMQLQLLKRNKNQYCRPGLRHYERADKEECAKHSHFIKQVTDKIWARNNPDWRPTPRKTPPKNPSKPKLRR